MELYPEVQLATLVDEPPQGEEWLHEIKFDGYRLLGFVSGGDGGAAHAQRQGLDGEFSVPRDGPGKTEGQRRGAGHGSRHRR